ncbi:hypothetical protein SLCC98_50210 [Listeria monocytogenes]|nr:hypothetical protein LM500401_50055 [Listeria monocytogenes]CUK62519.1 hypothetical protein LM600983_100005 [Listeria monocytogenes]CUL30342.1 hypothetical protein LM7416_50233 [Listeria monocytogenes]CUL87953.1 hypothetical protein LM900261_50212 [Listeria monocytogenes]CUM27296.1 hypothetical protein SLCC98_50210 [Listeria monocytogenes]
MIFFMVISLPYYVFLDRYLLYKNQLNNVPNNKSIPATHIKL